MAFETEGTVHKIFDTESKTETFKTREFVIKLEGQYPQFIKFQLTQDRCDIIEGYNDGDNIKVHFDLRGREWNDKYFTNLNAWKVERSQKEEQAAPPVGDDGFQAIEGSTSEVYSNTDQKSEQDFDDLPF